MKVETEIVIKLVIILGSKITLVEQHKALIAYDDEHNTRVLTTEQWMTADNACSVLKYLHIETCRLSAETTCVSDIIPITSILLHTLRGFKPT